MRFGARRGGWRAFDVIEVRRIRVRTWEVFLRVAGAGPTVVLVPGLGLSSRAYRRTIADLAAAGFHVVAPDPPGFGGTTGIRATGLDVAERAGWLLEVADALGIERAHWIGHSVGCLDILELAATAPERAASLTLVSPTGTPGRWRAPREAMRFAVTSLIEGPRVLGTVLREYAGTSPLQWIGTWVRSFGVCPVDHLDRVRAPTLILSGTRDPVVPRAYVMRLARGIAGARVSWVRGGTHGTFLDDAATVDGVLASFLRAEGTPRIVSPVD